MSKATLLAIHLRPFEGGTPKSVKLVSVLDPYGLRGDYHAALEDADTKNRRARAVTLIQSEALNYLQLEHGIALSAQESCRNLLTKGVDLNALVGQTFTIGDPKSPEHVVLRGTGLCHPCSSLERRTRPGVKDGLKGRGGLCAEVIKPGKIHVGDEIA